MHTHLSTYIHVHVCTYTYIHAHAYIHAYIHTYMRIYNYTYMRIYNYTYMRIYNYTYMHKIMLMHIHVYICPEEICLGLFVRREMPYTRKILNMKVLQLDFTQTSLCVCLIIGHVKKYEW